GVRAVVTIGVDADRQKRIAGLLGAQQDVFDQVHAFVAVIHAQIFDHFGDGAFHLRFGVEVLDTAGNHFAAVDDVKIKTAVGGDLALIAGFQRTEQNRPAHFGA